MPSKHHLIRSSMVVGSFALLGSVTGILVETSIAAKLGLSQWSDTFYVAYTVPYIITNLVSATAQFSLVPFFATLESRHSSEDLWKGFSYVINVLLLGALGITLLGFVVAPLIVLGIAPGFARAQTGLATQLDRWLFLILVPACLTESFRSFLLSQRRFALSSAAGFFRNVTVIAAILATFRRYGLYSIVLGYLAGHLLSMLILGVQVAMSFPVRYTLTLRGSGEAFRTLRGAGAAQVTAAVSWQGVTVAERIIASFLPAGTLTALNYGFKILSTLAELLAGSVGTASLPALSQTVVRGEEKAERKTFQDTLEIGLVLVAPVMIFCLLLARPIIRLAFERGNFTPQAATLMTTVFVYYSLSLFLYSSIRVLTFYLFARQEAGVFLRLSFLQYGLTVLFDLLYVGVFRMGAKGIPLGLLTALLLTSLWAYQRNLANLRRILDRSLAVFALKIACASALAALAVLALRAWVASPRTGFENLVYLSKLCGASGVLYLAVLAVSRAVPLSRVAGIWRRAERP